VSGNTWHSGWAAGTGVEWAFQPNWSAKVEYIHYGLEGTTPLNAVGVVTTRGLDIDTVKVGVNYLFH
jgi:outer membrane immunogenic protein